MNNNSGKRSEADKSEWRVFRDRLEMGQLVDGMVVQHAPFGMVVDIGNPLFPALAELPGMESLPGPRPGTKDVVRPAVGRCIKAVVVDLSNAERRQLRL